MQIRKRTATVFKWLIYIILLYLTFGIQTSLLFIGIFDIRPVLIVPLVIAISMQERELYALIFGLIAGFMWDFSAGYTPGFSAAVLMCCCIAVTLMVMYFSSNNFLNGMMFCGAAMVLHGLFDYLFGYVIWGIDNSWILLVRYILPTALYTTLVSPLFYFMILRIHGKLEQSVKE